MTQMILPQTGRLFLTDGGLETDMIYHRGIDLPLFASIHLLRNDEGRAALKAYYRDYIALAVRHRAGFILESATWRASPDWAEPLGMSQEELDRLNVAAVDLLHQLRREHEGAGIPILVSGCIGPRGDGYDPGRIMETVEAEAYHGRQAATLASAGPDMLCALTITNVEEAIGIARAAAATGLPLALGFTVETEGRLPTGIALGQAIEQVDQATGGYPAYFMINCAHPSHFETALRDGGAWLKRLKGLRANASACSHAELDAMTEVDIGDPAGLADHYARLREWLPQVTVLGGCCGTDVRHIEAIADACLTVTSEAA